MTILLSSRQPAGDLLGSINDANGWRMAANNGDEFKASTIQTAQE
jgi:hypothetical protein